MVNNLTNNINEWTMERALYSNNLVLKIKQEEIEEYQMKMLQNNNIPNLIKPQVKINNGIGFFHYSILGKLTLFEYARQYLISYQALKNLIETFIDVITILNEFLLEERNLIIDGNKIFIDLESKEFFFIYTPLSSNNIQSNTEIKNLIQELFKYIHKNDKKAIGFIHKLKIIMEEECYNIFSLKAITAFEENNNIHKSQEELTNYESREKEDKIVPPKKEKKSFLLNLKLKKQSKNEDVNRAKWKWNNTKEVNE